MGHEPFLADGLFAGGDSLSHVCHHNSTLCISENATTKNESQRSSILELN